MLSSNLILFVAIVVFVMMVIGLALTMREFRELTDEPSERKGLRENTRTAR